MRLNAFTIKSLDARGEPAAPDMVYTQAQLLRSCDGLYNRFIKRGMGALIALTALILLLPLCVAISLVIAIETGFPILYRPERGGYRGKTFRIYKFRTMVPNADQIGGGTTALDDPRITNVGAFLRKTKLDELPQLLNVISGRMALIGPRPELLRYTRQYRGIEGHILSVRPGITDFSSLAFISLDEIVGRERADAVYEQYVLKPKNQLRLKYVAELSFATDAKLLAKTLHQVIRKGHRALCGKRSHQREQPA